MSSGFNFSERVRKCLSLAREEAHALHHEYVGTEHMLLGLIREGEGVAIGALRGMGIEPQKLRADLLHALKSGNTSATGGSHGPDLPYTSRAKKVLELSMTQASKLSHSYVSTEHLLLGLIAEERGIAAQVLRHNGADLDRVRTEVIRILGPNTTISSEFPGRNTEHVPDAIQPPEKKSRVIESVAINIRVEDGSVHQEVFKDVAAVLKYLHG